MGLSRFCMFCFFLFFFKVNCLCWILILIKLILSHQNKLLPQTHHIVPSCHIRGSHNIWFYILVPNIWINKQISSRNISRAGACLACHIESISKYTIHLFKGIIYRPLTVKDIHSAKYNLEIGNRKLVLKIATKGGLCFSPPNAKLAQA